MLADVIDPEALDRFVTSGSDAAVVVSFHYAGMEVTVDAEGDVQISPFDDSDEGVLNEDIDERVTRLESEVADLRAAVNELLKK